MRGMVGLGLVALIVACKPNAEVAKAAPAPEAPKNAPAATAAPVVTAPAPKPADGPFGVRMGMTREEVGQFVRLEADGAMRAESATAPVPHPMFERYVYVFGDGIGLCNVRAVTTPITTNTFGEGAKRAFESLATPLEEKYGPATFTVDRVQRGSLWTKPEDWMMGLRQEDRELKKSWFEGEIKGLKNLAKLPQQDIEHIELQTIATGMNEVRLLLGYSFKNNDSCAEQAEKKKNKGL